MFWKKNSTFEAIYLVHNLKEHTTSRLEVYWVGELLLITLSHISVEYALLDSEYMTHQRDTVGNSCRNVDYVFLTTYQPENLNRRANQIAAY